MGRSTSKTLQLGRTLRPAMTLDEIYGELLYAPRASPNASYWLHSAPAVLNAYTGGQLTIAGSMAVLCSKGVSTPAGLQLLRDAGLPVETELHRFQGAQDHLVRLRALTQSGWRVVLLHAHPTTEVAPEHCWIAPELLTWLNNKAHLEDLVPPGHAPRRRVLTPEALTQVLASVTLPVVLKAATEQTTGGGFDVRLCRTREALDQAQIWFSVSERVVVEDYLNIARNLCINFAVLPDATVRYIGTAEQVSDDQGVYHGNWIDARADAPAAAVAVAAAVAAQAASRGYRGLMGVDLDAAADGSVTVFDLNFRANGSTTALLLHADIARRTGLPVMRLRSWTGQAGYGELLDAAYTAMQRGYFLPLASYDPAADGITDAHPRLVGVLLGATREEVQARLAEFIALGLS